MKTKNSPHPVSSETQFLPTARHENDSRDHSVVGRRSFLRKMGIAGASLVPATALLMTQGKALGQQFRRGLTQGDVDILRFLAAAEILETDLWTQYTEFAQGNPAYGDSLANIDGDMAQYIADNTDDEDSHQSFLNAFLNSVGAPQVNLDVFRVLPGSPATGSTGKLRLTKLMHL